MVPQPRTQAPATRKNLRPVARYALGLVAPDAMHVEAAVVSMWAGRARPYDPVSDRFGLTVMLYRGGEADVWLPGSAPDAYSEVYDFADLSPSLSERADVDRLAARLAGLERQYGPFTRAVVYGVAGDDPGAPIQPAGLVDPRQFTLRVMGGPSAHAPGHGHYL